MSLPKDEIIDRMESILNVASDFTRLKILYALEEGEKSV
ncbi:MAG: transcriptional regulator, partial [Bacilli bacterium]|nr:transcriptional regulator [Bacilli bacterium]